jgi:hypothetical protein
VETGLGILTELRETLGIPGGTSSSSTEPVPDVGETNSLATLLELDVIQNLQEIYIQNENLFYYEQQIKRELNRIHIK